MGIFRELYHSARLKLQRMYQIQVILQVGSISYDLRHHSRYRVQ